MDVTMSAQRPISFVRKPRLSALQTISNRVATPRTPAKSDAREFRLGLTAMSPPIPILSGLVCAPKPVLSLCCVRHGRCTRLAHGPACETLTVAGLLFLLAHPDDETFIAGGTIARYAAAGVEIGVVCATRGERGKTGDICSRDDLARVAKLRFGTPRRSSAFGTSICSRMRIRCSHRCPTRFGAP